MAHIIDRRPTPEPVPVAHQHPAVIFGKLIPTGDTTVDEILTAVGEWPDSFVARAHRTYVEVAYLSLGSWRADFLKRNLQDNRVGKMIRSGLEVTLDCIANRDRRQLCNHRQSTADCTMPIDEAHALLARFKLALIGKAERDEPWHFGR